MKTAWDLIIHWGVAQEEAVRREAAAREARVAFERLDLSLKTLLHTHGPISVGHQIFRAPEDPDDAVLCETITDAKSIPLEEHK